MEVTLREYRAEDLDAMWALDMACFDPIFRFSKRAMRLFAEAAGALARFLRAAGSAGCCGGTGWPAA